VNLKNILIALLVSFGVIVLPFIYKLPIPADTIPGLYHPMRDVNFGYSNGVPVKNPLITDPVRQQFAWKWLAVNQIKKGEWPLWNPYNLSGTPLLANFQSAVFYPLNILFFIPNFTGESDLHFFAIQWSWFIYLQSILALYFMYLYLRKIGLTKAASFFGGLVWAFCGFNVAWWEWGNVGHTVLWFPLMLYAVEKIINISTMIVDENTATRVSKFKTFLTMNIPDFLLLFAVTSSFLAGHLQSFIMCLINLGFYLLYKIPLYNFSGIKFQPELTSRRRRYWIQVTKVMILFILITSVQWMPTLEFIQKSARNVDPTAWTRKDWFFPYEHFINFIAPDYFGNPTTNNYWGVWNYGEFAGYIGIPALLFAFAIFIRYLFDRYKKFRSNSNLNLEHHNNLDNTLDIIEENAGVGFFLFALFINLILITKNPITVLFYMFNIPFLASTQPSRGIAIVDFALVILAAVGFNEMIKVFKKENNNSPQYVEVESNINFSYLLLFILLITVWVFTIIRSSAVLGVLDNVPNYDVFSIGRSNLILPTVLIFITTLLLRTVFKTFRNVKNPGKYLNTIVIYGIILITLADLGRFFLKFESFSSKQLLYPKVSILETIQNIPFARIMTEDSRIMAPNMNIPYGIQTVDGYDPLYLEQYGKLIGMWQREKPDLSPFPANRILTPHIPKNIIADISATDYMLSFGEYTKYTKLGEIGQTKLFKKETALPRAIILAAQREFRNEQELANYMYSKSFNPFSEGLVLSTNSDQSTIPENGFYRYLGAHNASATITKYNENDIEIKTNLVDMPGLLYLADTFDNGWQATMDGNPLDISKVNFHFRGMALPKGEHTITMRYRPQSFSNGLYAMYTGLFLLILTVVLNIMTTKRKTYE
jgi:hypothetical protein